MARVCEVCGNSSAETDQEAGDDPLERVTYHQIPLTGGERQKAWMKFCKISSVKNLSKKFVCSLHFERHFIQRDLRSELLGGVKRNVLTRNAVPTIRSAKRQKRKAALEAEEQRKRRKEEIEQLLNESGSDSGSKVDESVTRPKVKVRLPNNQTITIERRDEPSPVKKIVVEDPISVLRDANEALQAKVAQLEQIIEKKNEKITLAKTEMVNITAALQDLKNLEEKNLTIKVNEVLKEYLTENQIRRLIAGNVEIPWTNEEMFNGFVLRTLESFDFVQTQMKCPLPTALEMELWVHETYLKTGLLDRALTILKVLARSMSPRDRECVLLLGRTKANTKFTYDPVRDQVIDNAGFLYCIAVQGIFSSWHQIVYLDFDLIYCPDLLITLMTELAAVQFNVVAISGMCDQETIDLWSELEITPERHFLDHPVTKEPVFMTVCAMSTLTALWRVLIGEGFSVQDEASTVSRKQVEALVECKDADIRKKVDIGKRHLFYDESNKSNSRLAKELISHKTANALNLLSEQEDAESAAVLATLIELFRDWYDLMTTTSLSTTPVGHDYSSAAAVTRLSYGTSLEEQNVVLDGMYDMVASLRLLNDDDQFVQQAILVSVNSIRVLLLELRKKYPSETIPTISLTGLSLNDTFNKFHEVHQYGLASVNAVLCQLSHAIADHIPTAATNKLLLQTSLIGGIRPSEKPEPACDLPEVKEENACSFLAQYVAKSLHSRYSYLGDQTFVIERHANRYVVMPDMPTGLFEPSRLWTEQAKKLEAYVSDITFFKNEGVVENVVSSIAKRHPKMGVDIIRMYVEKRLVIKLRNMNEAIV